MNVSLGQHVRASRLATSGSAKISHPCKAAQVAQRNSSDGDSTHITVGVPRVISLQQYSSLLNWCSCTRDNPTITDCQHRHCLQLSILTDFLCRISDNQNIAAYPVIPTPILFYAFMKFGYNDLCFTSFEIQWQSTEIAFQAQEFSNRSASIYLMVLGVSSWIPLLLKCRRK